MLQKHLQNSERSIFLLSKQLLLYFYVTLIFRLMLSKKAFVIEHYSILILSEETKYWKFCALCLQQSVQEHIIIFSVPFCITWDMLVHICSFCNHIQLEKKICLSKQNFYWLNQLFSWLNKMFSWIYQITYLVKSTKIFAWINRISCSPYNNHLISCFNQIASWLCQYIIRYISYMTLSDHVWNFFTI